MAQSKSYVTSDTIAKIFGITVRRVQQLAKEGTIKPVQTAPYKFDLIPTIQLYIRHLSEKLKGKDYASDDTKESLARKLKAEADLKERQAEMAEIKLKEIKGEVHRSEDVEAAVNDLVYAFRAGVLALPGRLAMDVAECSDPNEVSAMITRECHSVLNDLVNYQYDPEFYQKRVEGREGVAENDESPKDGSQKAE